jgi:hypothetical protein
MMERFQFCFKFAFKCNLRRYTMDMRDRVRVYRAMFAVGGNSVRL